MNEPLTPEPSYREKCEACGTVGAAEYILVRVTNGALNLCRQCLDEFNAKNPELASLRAAARREAEDWAVTHTAMQNLCRLAGCDPARIVGDGHGVPGIEDLADLLKAEIDRLRQRVADLTAGLRPMALAWQQHQEILNSNGWTASDTTPLCVDYCHGRAAARLLAEGQT